MTVQDVSIPPHLQKQVEAGISGLDIIHGELKNLMLEAEQEFNEIATEEEEDGYSDAMLSMDRTRAEGRLDALSELYALTYRLSFAIGEQNG